MAAQWQRLVRDLGLLSGVRAWAADDGTTWVKVNHPVPHLRLSGRPRYLFTTSQRFLDPTGFPDQTLRGNIARDAQKPRRRALYCWDIRRALTLGALSFHVDKLTSVPLVITDLAIRQDDLNGHSVFAGWMLLDVLQDVAVAAPGRADGEIGAVANTDSQQAHLERFGLRPCQRPDHLTKPGTWYCYRRTRGKV
jgi:hypothetical protein